MTSKQWIMWGLAIAGLAGCQAEEEDTEDQSSSKPALISMPQQVSIKEPQKGSFAASVNLRLSQRAESKVTINYSVSPVTATQGLDFQLSDGAIEIPAGANSGLIDFVVLGDDLDEESETFNLTLTSATGASLSDTQNQRTHVVTILDEDPEPSVTFSSIAGQAKEGSGLFEIQLTLSNPSQRDVNVPFSISGLATLNEDFKLLSETPIQFLNGVTTATIDLDILADDTPEGGESVILSLESPTHATLGKQDSHTLLIPGNLSLNDTGITGWYDSGAYGAASAPDAWPNQDASHGRDAAPDLDLFDGAAGFSFTKIDKHGNALPSSNQSAHRCTYDNVTGLTWETKHPGQPPLAFSGEDWKEHHRNTIRAANLPEDHEEYRPYPYDAYHSNWRANSYKYFWFNSDAKSNGGNIGVTGDAFSNTSFPISPYCAYPNKNSISHNPNIRNCTTQMLAEAMNDLSVCGFKDWRLPTIEELRSLINYSTGKFDVDYFEHQPQNSHIFSATPVVNQGAIWCLNSQTKAVQQCNKNIAHHAMMVRG